VSKKELKTPTHADDYRYEQEIELRHSSFERESGLLKQA